MKYDKLLIAIIIIVAIVVVGAVYLYGSNDNSTNDMNTTNISNISNNSVANISNGSNSSHYSTRDVDDDNPIVSEEVKFNYQQGSGYYREVTYADGNFRQYNLETGELIGSSFEADQEYLAEKYGSME